MSQPDLVVKMSPKEKTALAKTCKAVLSMKQENPEVRPVSFFTDCIEGEFDKLGWVVVPPVMRESKGPSDRVFTRNASWDEDQLGATRDNEQLYRVKDGVEQRRVGGVWVKSLGVTTGKSSISAHVHIFGHKDGIVRESLGYIETYTSADEYILAVLTKYGPVPRKIRVVTEGSD